jgi:hypothetical protein
MHQPSTYLRRNWRATGVPRRQQYSQRNALSHELDNHDLEFNHEISGSPVTKYLSRQQWQTKIANTKRLPQSRQEPSMVLLSVQTKADANNTLKNEKTANLVLQSNKHRKTKGKL